MSWEPQWEELDLSAVTRDVLLANWEARRNWVRERENGPLAHTINYQWYHDSVPWNPAPLPKRAPKRSPGATADPRNKYQKLVIPSTATGREIKLGNAQCV